MMMAPRSVPVMVPRPPVKLAPPTTAADYRIEQTTLVQVGSDGSSRCRRESVYFGNAALTQRDNFLEIPAGERRRSAGCGR